MPNTLLPEEVDGIVSRATNWRTARPDECTYAETAYKASLQQAEEQALNKARQLSA